ncbi:MAG: hypothetical protein R3B36_02980 [Polyangiaceae bacterium]
MLPFTKRPGREEGSPASDPDVVTKESEQRATAKGAASTRRPAKSITDEDEVTAFIPSKQVGQVLGTAAPTPSARPATVPPPARSARKASMPPPAASSRPGGRVGSASARKFIDEEDDDGRTQIRGAPKVVKRARPQSTGDVIRASLESTRQKRDMLLAPPPRDLVVDVEDEEMHPADRQESTLAMEPPTSSHRRPASMAPPAMHQAPMMHNMGSVPPAMGSVPPPMGSVPPPMGSVPPPMATGPHLPPAAMATGPHPAMATGPHPQMGYGAPQAAPSVPAHFMVPQAPYSDGRIDPPPTYVTARGAAAGRPAASWALALLAAGLFVGLAAIVVARNANPALADTSASFVDPSRAPGTPRAAAAAMAPPVQPTPQPVAAPAAPPPAAAPVPAVAGTTPPAVGAAPPVGAPAVAEPPTPPPAAPTVAAAPAAPGAPPPVGAGPIGAAPPTASPPVAAASPPAAKPAPAPAKPASAPAPARRKPAPSPATVAAAEPKEKPSKPARKPKDDLDEETRKAMEELKKAQIESTF